LLLLASSTVLMLRWSGLASALLLSIPLPLVDLTWQWVLVGL
jgi:hypothetical protein